MDILFGSRSLEQLCHDDKLATRRLGAPSARKLRARLDDLLAAASLDYASKLPGRFHALTADRKGQFAFHLHGGWRLGISSRQTNRYPDGTMARWICRGSRPREWSISVTTMTERQLQNQYRPASVTPPGDTLGDLLEERGIRQAELATRMGVTPKFVNELIAGKATITPTTALALEKALDVSADFWMARDARYRNRARARNRARR